MRSLTMGAMSQIKTLSGRRFQVTKMRYGRGQKVWCPHKPTTVVGSMACRQCPDKISIFPNLKSVICKKKLPPAILDRLAP